MEEVRSWKNREIISRHEFRAFTLPQITPGWNQRLSAKLVIKSLDFSYLFSRTDLSKLYTRFMAINLNRPCDRLRANGCQSVN